MFAMSTQLEEHISKHTSDEEWKFDDCAFQTNTKESLQQHKSRATHVPENQTPIENFRCSLCGKAFTYKNYIIDHKRKDHKSFKRRIKLPNCEYKDNCMYNHNEVPANMFMCYECGNSFKMLDDLMVHRKSSHTVRKCIKYETGDCKYSSVRCWFRHDDDKTMKEKHTGTNVVASKLDNTFSKKTDVRQEKVFQEPSENLAPPSLEQNPSFWNKLMMMLTELNNTMRSMQNHNQSQLM